MRTCVAIYTTLVVRISGADLRGAIITPGQAKFLEERREWKKQHGLNTNIDMNIFVIMETV